MFKPSTDNMDLFALSDNEICTNYTMGDMLSYMREQDDDDVPVSSTSESDTGGNLSGIEIGGTATTSGAESAATDTESDDSSTETDSDTEMKKKKAEEGSKHGGEEGDDDDDDDSSTEEEEEAAADETSAMLVDDFKELQEAKLRELNEEQDYEDDYTTGGVLKWKGTGEFSVEGKHYRPLDYVEAYTNERDGTTLFYQITKINIDQNAGIIECKCKKLYRPEDTLLRGLFRYCEFNPKELFLPYLDEPSCNEIIQAKNIKQRITVNK